jgi:hypothetical protein
MAKKKPLKSKVKLSKKGKKWKIEGTTYINNDPKQPWPISFECSTKEEAQEWIEKHKLEVIK